MIPEIDTIEKTLKVALVGPPNVGKSTLINAIIGQKIAIMTHKPQTTRSSTLGILTDGNFQIVFADTPGIFEPRKNHKLEQFIVNNALKTIARTDLILLLVDAYIIQKIVEENIDDRMSSRISMYHEAMKILLKSKNQKKILIVANKVDTLDDQLIVEDLNDDAKSLVYNTIISSEYKSDDKKIIPVSALNALNIDVLIDTIKPYAKDRPWEFDSEQCTDISERALAEEITREQLYLVMHAEIPYSVKLDTDSWQEQEDGSISIHQSIIVLKDSQKNMIIGAGGRMVKLIGERSRIAITEALGTPVHLFLHVKVRADWVNKLRV
jgi:GTP-binding protein Era